MLATWPCLLPREAEILQIEEDFFRVKLSCLRSAVQELLFAIGLCLMTKIAMVCVDESREYVHLDVWFLQNATRGIKALEVIAGAHAVIKMFTSPFPHSCVWR